MTPRPGPRQVAALEQVPVFGPEPIGDAQATELVDAIGRDLTGMANVASQGTEPKGAPRWTSYADFGPMQEFTPVRIGGGGNKASAGYGFGASLPATAGGSSSIQDQLGQLGI